MIEKWKKCCKMHFLNLFVLTFPTDTCCTKTAELPTKKKVLPRKKVAKNQLVNLFVKFTDSFVNFTVKIIKRIEQAIRAFVDNFRINFVTNPKKCT